MTKYMKYIMLFIAFVLIGSTPMWVPVYTDGLMSGTGTSDDPLSIDTSKVATTYDIVAASAASATEATVSYSWSAGSGTAGDYGNIALGAIGSGANTATASTTTHPACWLFQTSSNSAWGVYIYAAKTVVTYSAFGSADLVAETLISIPTLSDATDTYTVELQITNAPTSSSLEPNNTIGIRYSHGINSGEWELFSQDNAGAESVDDLNVAVTADALYKLRIEVNAANTEAIAYINGTSVGNVTANMPNGVVCGARTLLLKSVGTTSRTVRVHQFNAEATY